MAETLETPAFVTDERVLRADLSLLRRAADQAGCKLLYSPKASVLGEVLGPVAEWVDGFACSSPNELRLLEGLRQGQQTLHLISPLITAETLTAFGPRLDYLTVNSLSQWQRLRGAVVPQTNVGLRLNPQLSFIRDGRYDPCRSASKLGVPLSQLAQIAGSAPDRLAAIRGLHFHSNCEATDFAELLATARHIAAGVPDLLRRMDWINLGGGYLFDGRTEDPDFRAAVALFRDGFGLDVFIEPGAAAVRRCGIIEATVHDIVSNDGTEIAILDTTVNHMPEVLEFQFEPDVLGHIDAGLHSYILAGCTCLPGDVFGEYAFDHPLTAGARIRFLNMGAYTMSKAHRFNGVALPTMYHRREDGSLALLGRDGFDGFAAQMGDRAIAVT